MSRILKVDGKLQNVDAHVVGDRLIEGIIDGQTAVIHRHGSGWVSEVPDDDPMPRRIGVEATIPEPVFKAITARLDTDHSLTWDRVMTQAFSMWALNQGEGGADLRQAYLGATFPGAA